MTIKPEQPRVKMRETIKLAITVKPALVKKYKKTLKRNLCYDRGRRRKMFINHNKAIYTRLKKTTLRLW